MKVRDTDKSEGEINCRIGAFNLQRLSTKQEKGMLKSFYKGVTVFALFFQALCGKL